MQDTFTKVKTEIGLHKILNWAACGPRVGHGCSRWKTNEFNRSVVCQSLEGA